MLNHGRFGSGEKTVVLQHGFVGGWRNFVPLIARLAPHVDVVAPDLPGFAGSAHIPTPGSIAGEAAVLADVVGGLGIERFSLLGHSRGGMVALQAALDFPERIDSLVLYGTAADGKLPGRFETWDESIARIESEGIACEARRIGATWFVDGETSPFFEYCLAAGAGADQSAAIACLRANDAWNASDRLGELDVPVLVICGDRDRLTVPAHSFALWQGIRDARLCILPECGHCAHFEKPSLFNQVVTDFFLANG